MRMILAAALVAGGCMHQISLTPDERCAASGMVANGFASSSGVATGIAWSGNTFATSRGTSYGESVSCKRVETHDERCTLLSAQASLDVKVAYNPLWRNVVICLGYWAFLVPGVVASLVSNAQREAVIRRADEAAGATACPSERTEVARDAGPTEEQMSAFAASVPAQTERHVVERDTPLFCTRPPGEATNTGLCFVAEGECGRLVDEQGGKFQPCQSQAFGSCFNYTLVMTGTRTLVCAPSITSCERQLEDMRKSPDASDLSKQCGIYRQKTAQ